MSLNRNPDIFQTTFMYPRCHSCPRLPFHAVRTLYLCLPVCISGSRSSVSPRPVPPSQHQFPCLSYLLQTFPSPSLVNMAFAVSPIGRAHPCVGVRPRTCCAEWRKLCGCSMAVSVSAGQLWPAARTASRIPRNVQSYPSPLLIGVVVSSALRTRTTQVALCNQPVCHVACK